MSNNNLNNKRSNDTFEIFKHLNNVFMIDKKILCDFDEEKNYNFFFPKIINPETPLVISPCDSSSQTENFLEYLAQNKVKISKNKISIENARKLINPIKFSLKLKGSDNFDKIQIENIYNTAISKEKSLSENYFVVYHATTAASIFLNIVSTILYNQEHNTEMNTILLRTKTASFKFGNNYMKDANNVNDYLTYHIQNNIETISFSDKLNQNINLKPNDLTNNSRNKYRNKCCIDWFSFYKSMALSVNLSLLGGNYKEGENTLSYFLNIKNSHTSPDFLIDLCVKNVQEHFNKYSMDDYDRKVFNDKCENYIKLLYKYIFQNTNNEFLNNPAVLLQIFIKKEITDKILKISTPCGNLFNIRASDLLKALQENKYDEMTRYLKDNYENISLIPSLKNNTKKRIDNIIHENNLINLQGRFIGADIDTLNTKGNSIVNIINFNNTDPSTMINYIYNVLYSLEMLANKISKSENKNDECIIM